MWTLHSETSSIRKLIFFSVLVFGLAETLLFYDDTIKFRLFMGGFSLFLMPFAFAMAWLMFSALRISTFSFRQLSNVCLIAFYIFGIGTLANVLVAPFVYQASPELLIAGPIGLGWTWGIFVVFKRFKRASASQSNNALQTGA